MNQVMGMFAQKQVKDSKLLPLFLSASLLNFALPLPSLAETAKDLFYQQLETQEPMNTGLSYWIELRRGKAVKKVDGRQKFKAGDRIKFHIMSNVSGHAHLVLMQGSTGKKDVLFPVKGKDVSNSITKGKEVALPTGTFLVFDNKAGQEKVRIAVSRGNIETASLLDEQLASKASVASIKPGSSANTVSSNEEVVVAFPEDTLAVANQNSNVNETDDSLSKDLFREDSRPKPVVHRPKPKPHAHVAHRPPQKPGSKPPAKPPVVTPPPQTIVVNTDPNQVLFTEVVLEHI